MPNCPQYVFAYFGILKAGAIVAQLNPLYVEREIEHRINRLKGDVPPGEGAASFEGTLEGAAYTNPGVAFSHEAIAVLQYTGGTTGVSHGAMLTHAKPRGKRDAACGVGPAPVAAEIKIVDVETGTRALPPGETGELIGGAGGGGGGCAGRLPGRDGQGLCRAQGWAGPDT